MRRLLPATAMLAALAFPNGATAAVFSNPDPIALPDNSVANPYPSNIAVSGLGGTVVRVRVTLVRILAAARDIDVLLVGPGARTILVSDACAGSDYANVDITLDDAATSPLGPSSCGPITSGTYKPTNHDMADVFPNAPAGPYPIGLSTFTGTGPNGIWSLYAVDDQIPDFGAINGGWVLELTSTGAPATKKKCKKGRKLKRGKCVKKKKKKRK